MIHAPLQADGRTINCLHSTQSPLRASRYTPPGRVKQGVSSSQSFNRKPRMLRYLILTTLVISSLGCVKIDYSTVDFSKRSETKAFIAADVSVGIRSINSLSTGGAVSARTYVVESGIVTLEVQQVIGATVSVAQLNGKLKDNGYYVVKANPNFTNKKTLFMLEQLSPREFQQFLCAAQTTIKEKNTINEQPTPACKNT